MLSPMGRPAKASAGMNEYATVASCFGFTVFWYAIAEKFCGQSAHFWRLQ